MNIAAQPALPHAGAPAAGKAKRMPHSGPVITISKPAAVEPPAKREPMVLATLHEGSKNRPKRTDAHEHTVKYNKVPGEGSSSWLFGKDGLSFGDIIDAINPLQHIPIIGTIYRWLTGDEIAPAASLAGGMLFGGPLGLAAAAGSVVFEEATGRDLGSHVMAAVTGRDKLPGHGSAEPSLARAPRQPEQEGAEASRPAALAMGPRPTRSAAATAAPAASSDSIVTLSEDQLTRLLSRDSGTAAAAGRPARNPAPAATASTAADADGVAQRMMMALDKYAAMNRAQGAAAARPQSGALVDTQG